MSANFSEFTTSATQIIKKFVRTKIVYSELYAYHRPHSITVHPKNMDTKFNTDDSVVTKIFFPAKKKLTKANKYNKRNITGTIVV